MNIGLDVTMDIHTLPFFQVNTTSRYNMMLRWLYFPLLGAAVLIY